ncbi:hypothetical protein niasHT_004431 [Heterodera trifolii]|uniref:B30.2/SPRY domain-containing protein n=1 Tax=Heterodera trifolii TaxID=157864 RepID=A0ABD2LQR9_9BILA
MSSNSIGSANCFFHPTAEQAAAAEEVDKYEVFSWHGDLSDQLAAQFLVTDQQRLKECREKLASVELREKKLLCKNGELNAENKALKAEMEKQKLMTERNELKAKVDKMEQEKQQQLDKKYVSVDVFNSLVERIKQLENQLKQNKEEGKKKEEEQQKESVGQQKLDGKYAVVDKNNVLVALVTSSGDKSPPAVVSAKIEKEMPNSKQQNGWDAKVCHKDIEIIGEKQLTINCKANRFGWRSIFAKFPITNFCRPGIFYFEMKVIKLESFATIGFATKEVPLDGSIGQILNSYGYRSDGSFGCNGINRPCKMPMPFVFPLEFSPVVMPSTDLAMAYKPSEFSTGDVVGCGICLDTQLIFLTKNGRRMDYSSFFISSPANSLNSLFPCVSLWAGDKIEANFGPNFKFNLATL